MTAKHGKLQFVVRLTCALTLLTGFAPAVGALAASDQDLSPAGEGRRPPPAAIEACQGKNEGDTCAFLSRDNLILTGDCLSGHENIFACRPHRGERRRESAREERKQMPFHQETPKATAPSSPGEGIREPHDHAAESKSDTSSQTVTASPPAAPLPAVPPPLTEQPAGEKPVPGENNRRNISATVLIGFCLAMVVMSVLLTRYVFFRSVIVPLRRLRTVTRQLSNGDLSARVGEGVVYRKDEVADLARDVDRMAERIEELVGAHQRLIRDVSHELRSPLARLNVALELARQSAGPGSAAPFDRIERESERLNELIGQLLMLTRLESESGMGTRAEMDMTELVLEVAQDVDFEARSSDRSVTATAPGPMPVLGNRELLRQALENLVRNAVRYTDAGTSVEITLKKREAGGRAWAHIEVLDHGPGVPESELFNIFRPFYRVEDSRERQSGGAGVGLAISDRAVRLHGGSLRAFNAIGAGLLIELELPL